MLNHMKLSTCFHDCALEVDVDSIPSAIGQQLDTGIGPSVAPGAGIVGPTHRHSPLFSQVFENPLKGSWAFL